MEVRAAERGDKRRHARPRRAQRAARDGRGAPEASAGASSASRRWTALQAALGLDVAADPDRVLRHLEPDGHEHGRVDGRVRGRRAQEVRLPALQHPRGRPKACRTTSRRWRRCCRAGSPQWERQRDLLAARPEAQRVVRDAAEPDRHRRRARASWRPACARWSRGATRASLSSRWPSGWRRSTAPASASRCGWRTTRRRCSCCSACATRLTASRSRTTARRRDREMTKSLLDELPGIGPARKRALLQHFGSPEGVTRRRASSWRRCPGCRARSRATSTRSCTAPAK